MLLLGLLEIYSAGYVVFVEETLLHLFVIIFYGFLTKSKCVTRHASMQLYNN